MEFLVVWEMYFCWYLILRILFLCFSLLEESGYIGRVTYVMDRLMHRLGLHGKVNYSSYPRIWM